MFSSAATVIEAVQQSAKIAVTYTTECVVSMTSFTTAMVATAVVAVSVAFVYYIQTITNKEKYTPDDVVSLLNKINPHVLPNFVKYLKDKKSYFGST